MRNWSAEYKAMTSDLGRAILAQARIHRDDPNLYSRDIDLGAQSSGALADGVQTAEYNDLTHLQSRFAYFDATIFPNEAGAEQALQNHSDGQNYLTGLIDSYVAPTYTEPAKPAFGGFMVSSVNVGEPGYSDDENLDLEVLPEFFLDFKGGLRWAGETGIFTMKVSSDRRTITFDTRSQKWPWDDITLAMDDMVNDVNVVTSQQSGGLNAETVVTAFVTELKKYGYGLEVTAHEDDYVVLQITKGPTPPPTRSY